MGAAGRRFIEDNHSLEQFVVEVNATLDEVLRTG